MDNLRIFFENNDVRIGEGKDFTTIPPMYYCSLDEAFRNYFNTFITNKNNYHYLLDIDSWTRKSLASNFFELNDNVIFSILNFHRFFELILKDILRRINPFLAVKFIEKENELFQFLTGQIDADSIKTIEFNETNKRFKEAYRFYEKSSDIYIKYLKDYEFIVDQKNQETLSYLTEWRNRIMHNGSTLPNFYAYEYLLSQRIIPLVCKIYDAEKDYLGDYTPHYAQTPTGIKILEELLSVKFEITDFGDKQKLKPLSHGLEKLGHLKELGRASFNQPEPNRLNHSYYEPYYESPIDRSERFAACEKEHKDFLKILECNCCGAKSLVVYRKSITPIFSNEKFISWFKCYNCDYSLKNNIKDPYYFNFSKSQIFAVE